MRFTREWKTFFWLLGGVTLLVLFLGSSRLLQARTTFIYDDRLFLNHAISLLQGDWLGDYNQFTLIKGPFYPVFLAVNYVLGLPLLISQQVIYCLSGVALIYALSYFCRDRWVLLLLYSLYVFHPIPFLVINPIREGIYASLTTFAIAGAILAMANLMGKVEYPKHALYHACFFGLSFGCFWLTREEGVWLLPCISLLIGLGFVSQYRQSRSFKVLIKQSRTLILSLLISITCVLGVALTNYTHYGVFLARSELLAPEFKAGYSALTRVKSTSWSAYVPVPRQVRQQLYAKSEKFRLLQPYLEDPAFINDPTFSSGCLYYASTCGDYAGGWFLWALRAAVAKAGYADTAPHTLKFYRDLATEVNRLCDSKQLECTSPHTGAIPLFRRATLQAIPRTIQRGLKLVTSLPRLNLQDSQLPSADDIEGRALFTEWTRTPTTPTQITSCQFHHLEVLGWFNRLGGGTGLVNAPGKIESEFLVKTVLPSPDLVKVFNDPKLAQSRFKLNLCCETCTLAFTDEKSKILTQVDLLQGAKDDRSETWSAYASGTWGAYSLDSIKPVPPPPPTPNILKLKVLDWLNVTLYQHLLYYATIFALGVWCFKSFLITYRILPWTTSYGIATSLLLAIATRIVIFSLIDVTSFPALQFKYLMPCATIVPIFTILVFTDIQHSRMFGKLNPDTRRERGGEEAIE
jgi:hypothetical protein